ncbi:ion transporter [Rapidithrix thailandica]|uniref:Ion transporter n=1 Tax=Rapidithrix thailandica TaxID=413964 RepID=A0AAW9S8L4_9BACT
MSFKQKLFEVIQPGREDQTLSRRFDYFIYGLIVLNVLAVVIESYSWPEEWFRQFLRGFEFFSVLVFSLEYGMRLWTSDLLFPKKSRTLALFSFVFSAYGLIDLLAILPFYLPFFIQIDLRFVRMLRLLRLLRILKLKRYSRSLKLVSEVFSEVKADLAVTVFITFLLLIFAASIMYNVEGDAQPENFSNIGQAFWWAVATLTTVGYGDIYPITPLGKLLSGLIALLGIGVVALPTGIISSRFIEKIQTRDQHKNTRKTEDEICFCPHCGKKLKESQK